MSSSGKFRLDPLSTITTLPTHPIEQELAVDSGNAATNIERFSAGGRGSSESRSCRNSEPESFPDMNTQDKKLDKLKKLLYVVIILLALVVLFILAVLLHVMQVLTAIDSLPRYNCTSS
ncbi:hypothetical protein OESDEN_21471 [Oesophagostomum dentatum]|uniref:Uncharacterized protein n=1 Tax=Oesophagostomum dentatum TaxID=61180 RepID=A0A0B1S6P0_OESDE|nr:hypothetical protein OESDEN_21471 [Oesophagostomum dentatum]